MDLAASAADANPSGEILSRRGRRIAGHRDKPIHHCLRKIIRGNAVGQQPAARGFIRKKRARTRELPGGEAIGQRRGGGANPVAQTPAGIAQIEQRRGEIGLIGQHPAETIAKIRRRCIARILPPRLVDALEIVAQKPGSHRQQRADHAQTADDAFAAQCVEAGKRRTAQQAMKNGFGAIIGMMREKNAGEIMLTGHARKQGDAQGAKAGGAVARKGRKGRFHPCPRRERVGDFPLQAKIPHERRIGAAGFPAGFMIEMHDMKPQIGAVAQQREQRDAVRASADTDAPPPGGDGGDGGLQRGIDHWGTILRNDGGNVVRGGVHELRKASHEHGSGWMKHTWMMIAGWMMLSYPAAAQTTRPADDTMDWLLEQATTAPATQPASTPAKSPFAEVAADDGRAGRIVMSDGRVIEGTISTTHDTPIRVWDETEKAYRDIPFRLIRSLSAEIVWEREEREWQFKESGSDIKVYSGRTYPARETRYKVTLINGQSVTGGIVAPLYAPIDGERKTFVLHKRSKGEIGQALAELVYVKEVAFGAPEPADDETKE